jgi:hypothetical protein
LYGKNTTADLNEKDYYYAWADKAFRQIALRGGGYPVHLQYQAKIA